MAARERIPARRYAEHGPFAATIGAGERGRLQTLIRQFEHTVGANGFFLDCLARSEADGPSLREWRSVSETTIRFESNGVRRTIRPDGTGRVVHDGIERRFWLEWDRGTERIAVLLEKLDRYAAYYRSHTSSDGSVPQLLVVCPTPHREDVVWRAAGAVFASDHTRCYLKTTSEPLLERRGPFSTVWRASVTTGRISLLERSAMYRHLTLQERMDRIAKLLLRAIALDDRWPDGAEHTSAPTPPDDDSNGERPSRLRQGDDRRST